MAIIFARGIDITIAIRSIGILIGLLLTLSQLPLGALLPGITGESRRTDAAAGTQAPGA